MLTLKQANKAVQFQKSMDTSHANIFAKALPHDDTPMDTEAIRAFEQYATDNQMTEALSFLHEALSPARLVRALSADNALQATLGGL